MLSHLKVLHRLTTTINNLMHLSCLANLDGRREQIDYYCPAISMAIHMTTHDKMSSPEQVWSRKPVFCQKLGKMRALFWGEIQKGFKYAITRCVTKSLASSSASKSRHFRSSHNPIGVETCPPLMRRTMTKPHRRVVPQARATM